MQLPRSRQPYSRSVQLPTAHSFCRLRDDVDEAQEFYDDLQEEGHHLAEENRSSAWYSLPLFSLMVALILTTPTSLPCHAVSPLPSLLDERPAKTGFAASLQPTEAQKQLHKLQNLQDERLAQCADNGKNWEQCFFYGTTPITQQKATTGLLPRSPASLPSMQVHVKSQQIKMTKTGIPTW